MSAREVLTSMQRLPVRGGDVVILRHPPDITETDLREIHEAAREMVRLTGCTWLAMPDHLRAEHNAPERVAEALKAMPPEKRLEVLKAVGWPGAGDGALSPAEFAEAADDLRDARDTGFAIDLKARLLAEIERLRCLADQLLESAARECGAMQTMHAAVEYAAVVRQFKSGHDCGRSIRQRLAVAEHEAKLWRVKYRKLARAADRRQTRLWAEVADLREDLRAANDFDPLL